MLLDEWSQHAEAARLAPGPSGEWPLNRLRWTLLQAALRAPVNARIRARATAATTAIAQAGLTGPVPLEAGHCAEHFDCGTELLNVLLRESVAEAATGGAKRLTTSVFLSGNRVAAYYSTRPFEAFWESRPAERTPLLFVARLGIDRRWSDARLTDDFFLEMLRDVWNVAPTRRPAALVGIAASPAARRVLRLIGTRMLGDALDPRAVIFPAADIVAALEASGRRLG